MAKKINQENLTTKERVEDTGNITEASINLEVKAEEPISTRVPDAQAMQILRVYPGYESLYVDRHGGAFTSDTPVSFLREAILYKNPFYQPSKTNK